MEVFSFAAAVVVFSIATNCRKFSIAKNPRASSLTSSSPLLQPVHNFFPLLQPVSLFQGFTRSYPSLYHPNLLVHYFLPHYVLLHEEDLVLSQSLGAANHYTKRIDLKVIARGSKAFLKTGEKLEVGSSKAKKGIHKVVKESMEKSSSIEGETWKELPSQHTEEEQEMMWMLVKL
ncbi:hypothetical protein KSP40_PGU000950 [Platanthera guangdongensis]|uniref:Uncharacterized protein n=1 Tax=Platanthera guangdongensis TaxID=2320717 RepID=A0ABR2LUJ1_9ASPA